MRRKYISLEFLVILALIFHSWTDIGNDTEVSLNQSPSPVLYHSIEWGLTNKKKGDAGSI